jgi:galactokinase
LKDKVFNEFKKLFSNSPRIFRAPGRVNLIGEHTDYNEGFVFPMAIDRYTYIAISKRDDSKFNIYSNGFNESVELDITTAEPKKHWSDYVVGVASILKKEGFSVAGADIYIDSNVPLGAGLSSSAAIEVSTAFAIQSINDLEIDKLNLAKYCQKTENQFVGMNCGIMDQFVSVHGKKDNALFLDCRSLNYELVPVDVNNAGIVVCNTMIKHELGATEYNKRRKECEYGVSAIKTKYTNVNSLRDATMESLEAVKNEIDDVVFRRCKHVITENERAALSISALKTGNFELFGNLLNGSHDSLRDDYEVSCKELDIMVDSARSLGYVFGCRVTGGGFGGCTINLVRHDKIDRFIEEIKNKYKEKTGILPDVYTFLPSEGVLEI